MPETVDVKFKGFDTMIDILLTIFWNAVFEKKVMFFGEMFTEICSFGSNLQRISIGSVNGDLKHFISPPRQNDHHLAHDISKCIFLNEIARISIRISLKFILKYPIDNKSALVQVMAWRRTGDKP